MFDDSYLVDGLLVANNNLLYQRSPRLLDQVRNVIRCKHYSIRTEQSYVDWIKRFIYFHNKQHPKDMGEAHIGDFLNKDGKGAKSPGDSLVEDLGFPQGPYRRG